MERLKIANHAVAVVTSPELEILCVTMRQLRELWKPGSSVSRYEQLGTAFPSAEVELYGPKITRDSFALFTRRVNGHVSAIRSRWEAAVNRGALTARLERSSHVEDYDQLALVAPPTMPASAREIAEAERRLPEVKTPSG